MGTKQTARRNWRVARVEADPRCDYCGEPTREDVPDGHPRKATVDDVIPLSKGGRNTADNWALACARCNTVKGDSHVYPAHRLPRGDSYRSKVMARAAEIAKMQATERARLQRKAEIAERFSLYTPIPGVPDEAFR